MDSRLYDKRADFFRKYFQQALPYSEFVATGTKAQQSRWNEFKSRLELESSQQETLSSFQRSMQVLCLAGTWCGDCARQCPMLNVIEEKAGTVTLRLLDNASVPELADELRIHGASRVPVVVVLSEDFFEVGRFGDRTLSCYRRKAATELGPACDSGLVPPSGKELQQELQDWIDLFERWHMLLRLSPLLRQRHGD